MLEILEILAGNKSSLPCVVYYGKHLPFRRIIVIVAKTQLINPQLRTISRITECFGDICESRRLWLLQIRLLG